MICRWLAGRIPGEHGVVTHNKRNIQFMALLTPWWPVFSYACQLLQNLYQKLLSSAKIGQSIIQQIHRSMLLSYLTVCYFNRVPFISRSVFYKAFIIHTIYITFWGGPWGILTFDLLFNFTFVLLYLIPCHIGSQYNQTCLYTLCYHQVTLDNG